MLGGRGVKPPQAIEGTRRAPAAPVDAAAAAAAAAAATAAAAAPVDVAAAGAAAGASAGGGVAAVAAAGGGARVPPRMSRVLRVLARRGCRSAAQRVSVSGPQRQASLPRPAGRWRSVAAWHCQWVTGVCEGWAHARAWLCALRLLGGALGRATRRGACVGGPRL
eukprot:GHVT01028215.1.p1 GENE.GHVT01028215.1~~GHVT01028215.1.p1  ORF type:complete len:165 (-),score=48.13 GHVT01028215.1:974-1468(-)